MSIRKQTPCDFGECPYNAQYNRDCEYWCGCDEPQDDPDWDDDDPQSDMYPTCGDNEININFEFLKGENVMPTNEINTGRKSIGNFTIEYQNSGYGGCIPVIDGQPQPSLMFGYVSEADLAAGMRLIENALRAAGNVYDVPKYIMRAMQTAANDIRPSEAVEISGEEILLSYAARKAYLGTSVIADLNDLTCELPEEAIRALLVSRAEAAMIQRQTRYEIEDDEWEDDYNDEEFDN